MQCGYQNICVVSNKIAVEVKKILIPRKNRSDTNLLQTEAEFDEATATAAAAAATLCAMAIKWMMFVRPIWSDRNLCADAIVDMSVGMLVFSGPDGTTGQTMTWIFYLATKTINNTAYTTTPMNECRLIIGSFNTIFDWPLVLLRLFI